MSIYIYIEREIYCIHIMHYTICTLYIYIYIHTHMYAHNISSGVHARITTKTTTIACVPSLF